MGSSSYSDSVYSTRLRSATLSAKGFDRAFFAHDDDIKTGKVSVGVHEKLDSSKPNSTGKLVRESFDSPEHPNSKAVAVLFDVTGSMSDVPKSFVKTLDKLMGFLVKKGYLTDPHILFGAVGDATCDRVPLQIGQFEAGNEMDEVLSLMYLEGGGGGQQTESYELAMYYMARHTDIDCYSKRGERGYLFLSGDELPYSHVKRSEVKRVIGDDLQEDIPTSEIMEELREKFEVFWILPNNTSYYDDPRIVEPLKKMFGQNLLKLEDPLAVVELIAATIGVAEGFDIHDVAAGLKDLGASDSAVRSTSTALSTYAASNTGLSKATVVGDLVISGGDGVSRL